MSDSTVSSKPVKRCSRGDECIHPDGPVMPRTAEYFYIRSNNTVSAMCRECFKARRRQRHQERREIENAQSREYYRKNPERYKHYTAKYYVRKLHNGGNYTQQDLHNAYVEQKGCCYWCGQFVGLIFDIDHKIPVSKGGTSDPSNIVISCRPCNDSKADKLPHEWNGREFEAGENTESEQ